MATLYARLEPTEDAQLRSLSPESARQKQDVVLYRDADATKAVARYPWYRRGKPGPKTRSVMHNCYRYQLEWLPAARPEALA